MDRGDRQASRRHDAAGAPRDKLTSPAGQSPSARGIDTDEDEAADIDTGGSEESVRPVIGQEGLPENPGEQAEFREQFDEDLYNDREDRPAQGNTADVAMGDHRFGSEAEAYREYAWRRPGDHHGSDASAVGQARDPADVADDDERP